MVENFYKKILDNGMTVILEKRNLPIVSVGFAVKNGAINESIEEKGISHFIEHMVFKGTKNRSVHEITSEIEKRGGDLNAFTSECITAFWCKMPSVHLGIALDVLSDLVTNPLFDEKEMEKERKVIFEEIKMIHDNPARFTFDSIVSCLFSGTLSVPIIGNLESMNSIDRLKLSERFNQVYTPNNMILCVVGDANFEELVKFVEENFPAKEGKIPRYDFSLKNEIKEEKREGIDQANLIYAYHVPLAENPKSSVAIVLNALMADGMSSRLFKEIREKRNLAYAVKGGSDLMKDFAYNYIYVGTTKENVELVRELIIKEFIEVAENLSEEELNKIKEQLIGQYKISMEDSRNQLIELIVAEFNEGAEKFYEFEQKIRDVSFEDVKKLADKASKEFSFYSLVPK